MLGRRGSRVIIVFGDRLRVAEVRGGRVNGLRVSAVAEEVGYPSGEVHDPHAAGKTLRELLRRSRIRARKAIAVLPSRSFTFRTLHLPPMPAQELRQAAWGEVEGYVRIPPEDVLFGLLPLGEVQGEEGGRVQVLAVVASRRMIERYREAVLAAGLHLESIEVASIAALRSLNLKGALGSHRHVCAVIVGDGEGVISVASEGRLRLVRTGEYAPRGERVAEALLADLRTSLRYYETRISRGEGVGRIVAVLDRPAPPAIASALTAEFGGAVQFDEPPQGAAGGQEPVSPYLHAVAAGAALARADRMITLPLRPVERPRLRRRVPADRVLTFLTLLLVFGIGFEILRINRELAVANRHLQGVRREAQELQAQISARQEEAAKQAKSLAAVLNRVQEIPRHPWSQVLTALEHPPLGVWLTSLEVRGGTTMVVEGLAFSPASVATLLERLSGMPAFEQVVLRSAQGEELARRRVVRFRIEATIRPPWGAGRMEKAERE